MADHGLAAEDGGVGVDHDLVLNRGMALDVAEDLTVLVARESEGSERHALVNLNTVADVGGFADDHARSVVDEESPADVRAGVDVDAGLAVGVLGHHPRDQGSAQDEEFMRDPKDRHGRDAWIAEEDFLEILGGGIAVERGLNIVGEYLAEVGDTLQKPDRDELRLGFVVSLKFLRLAIIPKGAGDLGGQAVVQAVDQVADMVADVPHVQVLPTAIAGIENLAQISQNLDDLAITWQRRMAKMMDAPTFLVGIHDPVRQGGECFLKPNIRRHANSPKPFARFS